MGLLRVNVPMGQCLRRISASSVARGKKNISKFVWYNKGTEAFKKQQAENPDPDLPRFNYGVRETGYKDQKSGRYVTIPEMIPEIIVPDLHGFKLKPYVSYRTVEVTQSEFTAENLFDAVYANKVIKDYHNSKLDEKGQSLEPDENERLAPKEAFVKARQTGADLFTQDVVPMKDEPLKVRKFFRVAPRWA